MVAVKVGGADGGTCVTAHCQPQYIIIHHIHMIRYNRFRTGSITAAQCTGDGRKMNYEQCAVRRYNIIINIIRIVRES